MNFTDYFYIFAFLALLFVIYKLNEKLTQGKRKIDTGEELLKAGKAKFFKHRCAWYGDTLDFFGVFDNPRELIAEKTKELASGKLKYRIGFGLLLVLLFCAIVLLVFFVNSIWKWFFE